MFKPWKGNNMKPQVIKLPIEHRGHKLVISQGVDAGSLKDFHVQVELLDGLDQPINSGLWYVLGATYDQINDHFYDDEVTHVDASDLEYVIKKAKSWVCDVNNTLFLQARKYLEDRHASAVEEASHPCFGYTQEVRDEYNKMLQPKRNK
jgi:hypothetical protein